jgi:hypothetical protein
MLDLLLAVLAAVHVFVRSRSDTALEVLALRQQVSTPRRSLRRLAGLILVTQLQGLSGRLRLPASITTA